MSDCCDNKSSEKNVFPRISTCPANQQEYIEVQKKTILQHLQFPWKWEFSEEKYYFCDDQYCDVVYFGINGSVISKSELRTIVGKKESSEDTFICYCFGVSKSDAAQNPNIKDFVTQQTKEKNCACEIRNPSGRCCLKDFP